MLEQHPVDLTFFFVPQVVQALRYDDLGTPVILSSERNSQLAAGYVARFIFETAKISQLFCHQIIWNMKANCYKDDSMEIVCCLPLPCPFLLIPTIGRPTEASFGRNDCAGCQVSLWRCSSILRQRIHVFPRGYFYLWQTQALHQEDKAREEGENEPLQ